MALSSLLDARSVATRMQTSRTSDPIDLYELIQAFVGQLQVMS